MEEESARKFAVLLHANVVVNALGAVIGCFGGPERRSFRQPSPIALDAARQWLRYQPRVEPQRIAHHDVGRREVVAEEPGPSLQPLVQRLRAQSRPAFHLLHDRRDLGVGKRARVADDLAERPREGRFGEPAPLQVQAVLRRSGRRLQTAVAVLLQHDLDHRTGLVHGEVAVLHHRYFADRVEPTPLGARAILGRHVDRDHLVGNLQLLTKPDNTKSAGSGGVIDLEHDRPLSSDDR